MEIVRKKLSAAEGRPPSTRYDPDTDTVETSVDGGVTWTPNPGADPRVNTAYQLPPNTEPDVECAAAAGMVRYVRQIVDAGIDGTTIAGIGNVLLGLLLLALPVSWFFALMAIVAEGLIAIGGAALAFSFSDAVYDQLLCIFKNNVDSDGRLDAAALAAVLSQVDSEIGDITVSAVMQFAAQMGGHVGFSNMGAKFADEDADCSDCPVPWAELLDFRISSYGFDVIDAAAQPQGAYVPGVGFITAYVDPGGFAPNYQSLVAARSMVATLTHVEATFDYTQGECFASGDSAVQVSSQSFTYRFINTLVCDVPTSPAFWNSDDDPGAPVDVTALILSLIPGVVAADHDPGGSATFITLKLCGIGDPPGIGVPTDLCE